MPSIVTITFSPCIDKTLSVPAVVPDIKLKCSVPVCYPGGGGINVARAVTKLGGDAVAVFPAGGANGEWLVQAMANEAVACHAVKSKSATRENIIVYDLSSRLQYRFNMPAPDLQTFEWQEILQAVAEIKDAQFIIVSGTLPAGLPDNIFFRLSELAKANGSKLIVDTSGPSLAAALKEVVFLIKPSLHELALLTGRATLAKSEATAAANQIVANNPCEAVIVSMGAEGAMLVTKAGATMIKSSSVEIKSTVGAGDSLVAGVALSLVNGHSLVDAARFGVACGTAATLHDGTQLCSPDDVHAILTGMDHAV